LYSISWCDRLFFCRSVVRAIARLGRKRGIHLRLLEIALFL
jgi:hypothetical protein